MDLLPRILLVEDDLNFARVIGSHLRRNGFAVQSVRTDSEAHTALIDGAVDALLVGVRRPDSATLESISYLVALAQGAPVFLMTSAESEDLAPRAIETGLSGVFYKPVDLDAVIHSLRTHLPQRPVARCLFPGQPVSVQILSKDHVPATRGHVVRTTNEAFHVDLEDPLNADDRLEVSTPGDDAIYEFRSKVLGADDLGRFILSKPSILRRRQRRRHPRIPLVRSARIHQGDSLPSGMGARPARSTEKAGLTVQTADVSLGGMSLTGTDAFEVGEQVHIEWGESSGHKSERLRASGIVVRCDSVTAPGMGSLYRIGVRFHRTPRNLRNSLQRYLDDS